MIYCLPVLVGWVAPSCSCPPGWHIWRSDLDVENTRRIVQDVPRQLRSLQPGPHLAWWSVTQNITSIFQILTGFKVLLNPHSLIHSFYRSWVDVVIILPSRIILPAIGNCYWIMLSVIEVSWSSWLHRLVCCLVLLAGKRACTGYDDGNVRIFDLKNGSTLHNFTGKPLLVHVLLNSDTIV